MNYITKVYSSLESYHRKGTFKLKRSPCIVVPSLKKRHNMKDEKCYRYGLVMLIVIPEFIYLLNFSTLLLMWTSQV